MNTYFLSLALLVVVLLAETGWGMPRNNDDDDDSDSDAKSKAKDVGRYAVKKFFGDDEEDEAQEAPQNKSEAVLREEEEYGFISLDGEVWNTTKCSREEFEEASEKYSECITVEDQDIADSLQENPDDDEAFRNATCKGWANSITCIEELADSCYTKEFSEKRINSLREVFLRKAQEQIDVLGEDFIESCPELEEDKNELLEAAAGSSDKCTWAEYQESVDLFKECVEELSDARTSLNSKANVIDDLEIRQKVYIFSECRSKHVYHEICLPMQEPCLTEDKMEELMETYNEREETLIATGAFPEDFSFESHCEDYEKQKKKEDEKKEKERKKEEKSNRAPRN